jgi:1-deoxy-D-xylulose-5-phosphate reductoisomerase
MLKRIAVLGSTGSIGVNTLDVAASLEGKIEVVALSADSNAKLLIQQARAFKPKVICIGNHSLVPQIKRGISKNIKVLSGKEGLEKIVSMREVETVVFAISGIACIEPLALAIKNKKRIALANKEALVSAGSLLMRLAKENGVTIVPIDSEHSAVFQCLDGKKEHLKKICLTATGGPLLNIPRAKFDSLPARFILNHPKWSMGKKISVDSATMMNKGLEIIEAKWLFDIDEKHIDVLVHPEAIVHSMVEMKDGSVLAQMSVPDMRLPIQYAITYPERLESRVKKLSLAGIGRLSFKKPDTDKFPCLQLARIAVRKGGAAAAALNVADEVAVKKYLENGIKFSRIPDIIGKVLDRYKAPADKRLSLSDIFDAQRWAREEALRLCL